MNLSSIYGPHDIDSVESACTIQNEEEYKGDIREQI